MIKTPKSKFIINVCGSVVDSDIEIKDGCRKDAAGCEVVSANVRYDLADPSVTGATILARKKLLIAYTGGDSGANGRARSMKILLTCDMNAAEGNSPTFVDVSSQNEYLFQWNTKYACPKESSSSTPVQGPDNCDFHDTDSDKHWDLSALARTNTDWFVYSKSTKQQFYLNICRPLQDALITEKTSGAALVFDSAAQTPTFKSLGMISTRKITPQKDDMGLLYRMDNGYDCGRGFKASVNVRIFCDPNAGVETPTFTTSNSDCDFEFAWYSKYGCPITPPHTSCDFTLANGKSISLKPLRKDTNYEVKLDPSEHAIMNMCGPIVPRENGQCANTAICGISSTDPNRWKSFGAVGSVSEINGDTMMHFEDGDICDADRRITSTVHFTCDEKAGNGEPQVLQSADSCDHQFLWKTSAACPTHISGAMIFFWIVFSLVLAYIVLGVLYKRFRLGYRGLDQIPNIDFWLKVVDVLRCRREPAYAIQL